MRGHRLGKMPPYRSRGGRGETIGPGALFKGVRDLAAAGCLEPLPRDFRFESAQNEQSGGEGRATPNARPAVDCDTLSGRETATPAGNVRMGGHTIGYLQVTDGEVGELEPGSHAGFGDTLELGPDDFVWGECGHDE